MKNWKNVKLIDVQGNTAARREDPTKSTTTKS